MDMKEKLVELLHKGVRCPGTVGSCMDCPHYSLQNPCDEYAATADMLIANGVTVLPCNVGDKIYYIDRYTGKIEEDTVKFLTITKSGAKPILTRHNIMFWDFYELGKTAFLTKNEVETTLPQPPKENKAMKCETCEVRKRIEASDEPACCVWYIENVVCGDKSVEDCNAYEPPKGE